MITIRTPLRISLCGGGTDYPEWCQENGGAVLGFTIDKYIYLALRELPPFFPGYRHRLCYSEVELVNSTDEIKHPAIRACLREYPVSALEMVHYADLPGRSGLGSSSAFVVGLLRGLYQLRGQCGDDQWFAEEAIRIEREVIGEPIGYQDQIWAAMAGGKGVSRIDIDPGLRLNYRFSPLNLPRTRTAELLSCCLLVFTGISRYAAVAAAEQIERTPLNGPALREMRRLVDDAEAVLRGSDPVHRLGEVLHAGWLLKRGLAPGVTNPTVDALYAAARAAGATGGKLLGAGGGGFMLFVAPEEKLTAVKAALRGLIAVPFGFSEK